MVSKKNKTKTKRKKSKKTNKPIGLTKIPKGNAKKIKPGIAFLFGSLKKPRFGKKRFKTTKKANDYAIKKGLI